MAGAAAPGKLTAPARTRFAVASEADDVAIRRLLRDNPMRGAVDLTFEREPNYFRGVDLAGGDDQTIVAFKGPRLVCMGRCSQRDCWVNGEIRRAGYLAELRLDQSARGKFAVLRDGYQFFHALRSDNPADLFFTSIAADNERARKFLEAGVRGLPTYEFLEELDTLLIAVPRRPKAAKLRLRTATAADIPDLVRILNDYGRQFQFATVWTPDRITSLERHGLPIERFLVATAGDEIVACGALWDQRKFRQTVIRGYAPLVSTVRPLLNMASRILGKPGLPPPSSVLSHAFLSPLSFASSSDRMLPDFVESCFSAAAETGIEFLTLALPTMDGRLPELRRRFTTRTWRSRLYRVDWPDRGSMKMQAQRVRFLPDIAFL
jgi:hypothetical protein